MLTWIIDFSLKHRLGVILATLAAAVAGALSLRFIDIDAFPDTTPVQVQINTVAPALGPEECERQITFPIEQTMGGMRGLKQMRSISQFGMSQVVLTFADGTDIYFARQLVNERLAAVELPLGLERPKMGPVATGLGEVFHYVISGKGDDQTSPRTIHDWVVRPQLRTLPGVAEINTWGGFHKQYQARVAPENLIKHGLTFAEVMAALEKNNRNSGGGSITQGPEMLLVHGLGRTVNLEQVGKIVVASRDGIPIRIRDLGTVEIGHEIRRGAVTANGQGEVVLGLGFMLMGENTHQVTLALKGELERVKQRLPAGMIAETVYDRTELVDHVIATVRSNLFEAGLLVVAILYLFLGGLRAAFLVALAIPLSMLFAFSGMYRFGIAASLLSLGAIDFGMIVDSSVVMVENCARHLARGENQGRAKVDVVRDAAVEVRQPTLFGELIIMIVYMPILTLEGIEGKLFRPMALTVIFALLGSLVLSLTLMPALASLLLGRGARRREPLLMRLAHAIHGPILAFAMRFKLTVLAFAALILFAAFALIAPNLGSEFIPKLSEGAIALNVVRLAGTDIDDSVRINTFMERAILKAFPNEVKHVWSRIGSAEIATDPMGVELTDIFLSLKPRAQWKNARTQEELTRLLEKLLRDFPGQSVSYTQPIELRMNEMDSGVKQDLGVKVFGDDLAVLVEKAGKVEEILRGIPGAADVAIEQVTGQPILQIRLNQEELARYGVPAASVLDLVESIGGKRMGDLVEGQFRFPLVVRLAESYRQSPESIGAMLIATPAGERIPLSRLAHIEVIKGPSTITREWGQRRVSVNCNVRLRDIGSFVKEAQAKVAAGVVLPEGRYHIEWGGQFEHLIRAQNRLMIVVPIALALILMLLYAAYGNLLDMARVFTGVPFAAVGGIFALWLRDMPFSISAAVGFIAMSGVAVLDDMILVSRIRQLRAAGLGLEEAVRQAAITRLRPVLMTALVAGIGFLPMAFSEGMGAEVQKPLATVVIGGVLSAMVMSLFVVRVLYLVFQSPFSTEKGKVLD
ncbi:MAG: efflux RND transporter permease subunit [Gemmataceae bacterium]|nr:efflux RND transporter permease subunit [Gemmataceae bacterium]